MIKLSPRLLMTASLVREGRRIADIGTDHAFLPAYLVLSGKITSAIASDVKKGPLENAGQTVAEYGLADKIELRLSDGFDMLYYTEADDYVLAGMGGTLMAELISRTPWLKDENLHLVLQPQSHAQDIRKYLCENGFKICTELITDEGGRLYIAFDAYFTGEAEKKDETYYYFGSFPEKDDGLSALYVEKLKNRLIKEKTALKNSGYDYKHIDEILRGVEND
ncbi:MAG: class I SAM-dependent methyltransferase [Clostridiales bacterium]|nr:class I SAM-dependent methyltransferase [Clostridiales bacterium]